MYSEIVNTKCEKRIMKGNNYCMVAIFMPDAFTLLLEMKKNIIRLLKITEMEIQMGTKYL